MAFKVNNFTIISAKLTPASNVIRSLIACDVTDESVPADRSIMLHNVPPLVNEKNLNSAFSSIAPVQRVKFVSDTSFGHSLPIGYNKAIIVFEEEPGLTTLKDGKFDSPIILSIPLTAARLMTPIAEREEQIKHEVEIGKALREKADEIVKLYDEEVRLKTKVTKSVSGEVDEEGWQTVRRNRPDSLNREKALLVRSKQREEKKKRIESNVSQVYQYRMRNEKLGKLRLLRKKFEEDKFKLAQMRAGRKFKP